MQDNHYLCLSIIVKTYSLTMSDSLQENNPKTLKEKLKLVFDDDLRTKLPKWKNWVDYLIIGLIIVSTVAADFIGIVHPLVKQLEVEGVPVVLAVDEEVQARQGGVPDAETLIQRAPVVLQMQAQEGERRFLPEVQAAGQFHIGPGLGAVLEGLHIVHIEGRAADHVVIHTFQRGGKTDGRIGAETALELQVGLGLGIGGECQEQQARNQDTFQVHMHQGQLINIIPQARLAAQAVHQVPERRQPGLVVVVQFLVVVVVVGIRDHIDVKAHFRHASGIDVAPDTDGMFHLSHILAAVVTEHHIHETLRRDYSLGLAFQVDATAGRLDILDDQRHLSRIVDPEHDGQLLSAQDGIIVPDRVPDLHRGVGHFTGTGAKEQQGQE